MLYHHPYASEQFAKQRMQDLQQEAANERLVKLSRAYQAGQADSPGRIRLLWRLLTAPGLARRMAMSRNASRSPVAASLAAPAPIPTTQPAGARALLAMSESAGLVRRVALPVDTAGAAESSWQAQDSMTQMVGPSFVQEGDAPENDQRMVEALTTYLRLPASQEVGRGRGYD